MEVVRAALRDGVDDAAEGAAVLGRVAGRLHLDLLEEVGDEVLARQARRCGSVVSTPSMTKRFSEPEAPSIEMPPRNASLVTPGAWVTTVVKSRPFGRRADLLGADRRRGLVLAHGDLDAVARDDDGLRDRAELQGDVQDGAVTEGDRDARGLVGLEAREARRHLVGAGEDAGEAVLAARVRDGHERTARTIDLDRDPGERLPVVGRDLPGQKARLLLGERGAREKEHRQQRKHQTKPLHVPSSFEVVLPRGAIDHEKSRAVPLRDPFRPAPPGAPEP